VGIVVPKRGRTTSDRNRLKRRLRELIRIHVLGVLEPMDLVIHTRPEAYRASFSELQSDVLKGVARMVKMVWPDGPAH
jgi:ribonuclease P protein component